MLQFLADMSPFETAHLGGMIVLGGAFAAMFVGVVWHLLTRGDRA